MVEVDGDPDLSVVELADDEDESAGAVLPEGVALVVSLGVVVDDGLCATVVDELLLAGGVAVGVVLVVVALRSQPATKAVPRARMAMGMSFMESPVVVDQNQQTRCTTHAMAARGRPGPSRTRAEHKFPARSVIATCPADPYSVSSGSDRRFGRHVPDYVL